MAVRALRYGKIKTGREAWASSFPLRYCKARDTHALYGKFSFLFFMTKLKTSKPQTKADKQLARVKCEQVEAQRKRTVKRVAYYDAKIATRLSEGSSDTNDKSRGDRTGRGSIDRYGCYGTEQVETQGKERQPQQARKEILVGPASGLPPPTPDPRYNPLRIRSRQIHSETHTWTGLTQQTGRVEWSRINQAGDQEWISAVESSPREWKITLTHSSKPKQNQVNVRAQER